VGRLEPIKGPDVLIDAWAHLHRLRADVTLHVIGDGSLSPALRARAERRGIADAIVWEGAADAQRVASLLAAADAVAIPSRSESIPLVLSEAIQMGAPLAVTDVGDMGLLVRRFGLGAVAPPDQPAAFAVALGRVLAVGRTAYAARLAAASRMFDLDMVVARLEEALQRAASGQRDGGARADGTVARAARRHG
jgi:glycosyltransferase involved in cell wall biosynthesis